MWSVLVYYPVARWSWYSDGWSKKLGVMDFAGGTPVHIVSGTTVATFSVFCSIERHENFEEFKKAVRKVCSDVGKSFYDPWKLRMTSTVDVYRSLRNLRDSRRKRARHPQRRPLEENGDNVSQEAAKTEEITQSIAAESRETVEGDCSGQQEALPQTHGNGVSYVVPNSVLDGVAEEPPAETSTRITPKRPESYSINYVVLGTAILWFGWAGFK